MRDGLVDAFNKRDVDRVLSYLHPDIVVTWQNGEVSHGREGVRRYYEKMMVGPSSIVVDIKSNPQVESRKVYHGDTSVSYGAMNDWYKLRDGTEVNLNSRFSALLARQPDGKWLVTGFHASGDAFKGEVHNLYAKKAATKTALVAAPAGLVLGTIVGWGLKKRRGTDDGSS
jgi:ketosteroid isomerase-like protein